MTRVAVLVSGHLRTYKMCIQSISDRIFKIYDTDVFINIWDDTEDKLSQFKGSYLVEKEDIIKTYLNAGAKNVFINIESYSHDINNLDKSLYYKLTNKKWFGTIYYGTSIFCQWYKLYNCNKMKNEHEYKFSSE